MVQKCLAVCQGLVESNIRFTFNISLAQDVFIFYDKELAKSSCEKKKSPSQLRRGKKRKEERKNKKKDTVKVSETLDDKSPTFKCDHCEA